MNSESESFRKLIVPIGDGTILAGAEKRTNSGPTMNGVRPVPPPAPPPKK